MFYKKDNILLNEILLNAKYILESTRAVTIQPVNIIRLQNNYTRL